MFSFSQQFEEQNEYLDCVHLINRINAIDPEHEMAAWIVDEDMEQETLASMMIELQEEAKRLAEEAERQSRRYDCYIGPYANGICTICGGNEPTRT